jgi:uncharacterized protein (TIGR03000 family)
MTRLSFLAIVLAGLVLPSPTRAFPGQPNAAAEPARLVVIVPADARLHIEGARTRQTGDVRRFVSPPLTVGERYVYKLKATWKENGKAIAHEQEVPVQAGIETSINLQEQYRALQKKKRDQSQKPAVSEGLNYDDQSKKTPKSEVQDRRPDVIYVPTPQVVVDKMLELADVKRGDVVYDLGCGDGRIVVTAAKKFGVKATGFDIDPDRVKESRENVRKNNVENLVTIKKADIFKEDLSKANVVTLYLLAELNVKLMPQLEKLKPGSRIVSHDFDMHGAKPKKAIQVKAKNDKGDEREHTVYLWVVPWEKE